MMQVSEVKKWLDTLPLDAEIGINDGGMLLTTPDGKDWLEIGGLPED
jgi:hypothetical protein